MNRSNKDWFYMVAKFKWSLLARTPSREDGARKGMLNDAAMFLYVALFLVFVCGAVSRFVDIITSVCYLRLVLAALLCYDIQMTLDNVTFLSFHSRFGIFA